MFDIRLRLMGDNGTTKGRVLPTLDIDVTQVDSSSPTLGFVVSEKIAGRMDAPFVVAVEYSTGGAFKQPRNGLFMAAEDDADDADPTGTVRFSAEGFVPWMLAHTYLHWSQYAVNGERLWTETGHPASAGTIMGGMILESQARGWGASIATDFTWDRDSAGVLWTADEKVLQSWRLLTTLSSVLGSITDQGLCDWWAEGTTLRLFRPGAGTSRENLVLGGPSFDSRPTKSSFNDVFTDLTVVPEKASNWLYLANPGASTRFGRLEATMTQSGIADHATATVLAQATLAGGRGVKRELSFDWTPASGGPSPWAEFNVGDLVTSKTRHGKMLQRVVGLQVSKKKDVTVRVIVGDKLLSRAGKTAKRVGGGSIGGTVGGTGNTIDRPGTPNPAAPTDLVVTSEAYFDNYGTAYAKVTGVCSPVVIDELGGGITVKWYELWGKKVSAGESWILLTRTQELPPSMVYSGLLAGETWGFKARVSTAGNLYSDFSTVWSMTLAKDLIPPDKPATPIGNSRLGQVSIAWPGWLLDEGGNPILPPPDFSHAEILRAPTATGNGFVVGRVSQGLEIFIVPDQQYNVPRWYSLVAVDYSGNRSVESDRVEVTTQPLVDTDVSDELMDSITEIVSQDVITNIGGTITWATRDPAEPDGTGKPVGAVWYRRDGSNNIIGMWEWSGTAWQSRSIDAGAVAAGAITDAKIATGAVLEAKLADAAVATAKLKDSAITEVKIANLAVGTAKIADAAIVNAKIGNLAVSSAKIADAAIVTAKIGNAQITNAKIGDAEITDAKIVNLNAGKINAGFIDAARIQANTISANKLTIGDTSNLLDDASFVAPLGETWSDPGGNVAIISSAQRGRSIRFSADTATRRVFSNTVRGVNPGDQFRAVVWGINATGTSLNIRVEWLTDTGAAAGQSSNMVFPAGGSSSVWERKTMMVTAPETARAFQFVAAIASGSIGSGQAWFSDPQVMRAATGELIVDGAITALALATNSVESNKIAANAITADKIEAGAITTVKLAALAITSAKIAADAIDVNKLAANAISSKHTITSAKFQTTLLIDRGIKIDATGFKAYNSAGQETVNISASTGDATFTGTVRNNRTGPRVEISSLDTQAVVRFYGASEGGNILPAQIYSDPVGQSLFLAGGNPNTSTPIYSMLQLNERTSSVSWFLGRSGFNGAAAYPRMRGDENTNTFWERSTGHRIAMATDGYTELVGNGLKIYGSLNTTGSKNFVMDHPTKPGVSLTHASTESPHNGVEYWSDGLVEIPGQGFKTVTLPPYFEALTAPDHRVAILTSGTPDAGLSYEAIVDGKMIVHGTPGALFSWVVKARRVKVVDGVDVLAFPIESATTYPTDPTEPTNLELQGVQP